jgi:hypothetical protein
VTIQDLGRIGEMVGAIATVATLAYLAVQIRQNTRTTRATNFHNLIENNSAFTSMIGENEDLALIYMRGVESFASPSDVEKLRFTMPMNEQFTQAQTAFYLHRDGLLDDDVFEGHKSGIARQFESPGVREWWDETKAWHQAPFRAFVDSILDRTAAQQNDTTDSA